MKRGIGAIAIAMAFMLLIGGCAAPKPTETGIVVTTSLEGKPVLVGDKLPEFPLAKEPTELNILIGMYGSVQPKDVYVWQKYQQMTGVSVNWTAVTRDMRSEALNTALVNGTNLDIIMRCKISSNRLTQYGEKGLILDLAKDGLLEKNAPSCWAYLQSHPETLASVLNPDGSIYALPQVNSGAELRVSQKIFINKKWLANVGLSVPKTTEEFSAMLRAFKEGDANGNGDKEDELPLCSANWQSICDALFGAFGLANRGLHNLVVDSDPQTGKTRLIAASAGYKSFFEYMHGLYSEGLLDKYVFTISDKQWTNNIQYDKVGVFMSTNLAWLPADKLNDWVAIEDALEGPNGDKLWSAIRANFHSTGAAALPATCKDPALALRWLDYFWTDEGTLFYHMGIEGETFTTGEDGSYDYAQSIYDEITSCNKSFDDVVATYSPYPGGSNPTVEIAPYFRGGEMADVPAQAARKLFEYGPSEYWPSFTFTAAENDTLDAIRTDLEKYISASQTDFVTGEKPLADWDSYVARLELLRMRDMLDIYQSAVDRYYAGVKSGK